jgi:hypothetical protein
MSKAVLESTVVKPRQQDAGNWWEKTVDSPVAVPNTHGKIMQTINFNLGSFDDKNRTFTAIASTAIVDRAGEVVDQATWDLNNFKNNPVIPWAHDYYQPPVGRAVEIGVIDGVLKFTYQAPPQGMYEFADLIWNFYRNQYMFAFSVGFLPAEIDNNTFKECELLEISAVVVPANPQALMLAYKMGDMDIRHAKQLKHKLQKTIANLEEIMDMNKSVEGGEDVVAEVASKAPEKVTSTQQSLDMLNDLIEGAVEKAMNKKEDTTDKEIKGAISSSLPLADKGTAWDKGAAVSAVKKWASNADGEIDFGKYKKAFMWVADGAGDKQGDYKLPFATVSDDKLVAVWNAVKAIMGVLNGARGGVQGTDRQAVYTQVKKYYKKFGETAPPLKSVEDLEIELKAIEEMESEVKTESKVKDESNTKGSVAEELAEDAAQDEKQGKMNDFFEIVWAFCDVYFDEDTSPDDFGSLLSETISLLQKVAAGTYNDEDDDEGNGDNQDGEYVQTNLRSLNTPQAKLRFAQFMVKVLTGKALRKDNVLMGKKDLAEGNSGGALTPTQMAHLKAVQDYLSDTKSLLDMHTDALGGHAQTMKAHADMLAKQSKGLDSHIKSISDVVTKADGPGDDGISKPKKPASENDSKQLDVQKSPDNESTSSLDTPEPTEQATDTKAKGEVKSEENPTDGADQSKASVDEKVEKVSDDKDTVTKDATTQESPEGNPEEDKPEDGKATVDKAVDEKTTESKPKLTDDTMVDPDNLSDEEAEEIVRAVNDALAPSAK